MASVREVFGEDFGVACNLTLTEGANLVDAFPMFPMCHDPAPIVDALHAMRAYKELQAFTDLATEGLRAAEKRRDECLDKLRGAKAAVGACVGLVGDESKPYIDAIDTAIEEKTRDHDALVRKATEAHDDASRRSSDVMLAIVNLVKEVRGPAADPPSCMTCPVCMDALVDMCFVECGHTTCDKCVQKCKTSPFRSAYTGTHQSYQCHMCRSSSAVVTLRFSMGD